MPDIDNAKRPTPVGVQRVVGPIRMRVEQQMAGCMAALNTEFEQTELDKAAEFIREVVLQGDEVKITIWANGPEHRLR